MERFHYIGRRRKLSSGVIFVQSLQQPSRVRRAHATRVNKNRERASKKVAYNASRGTKDDVTFISFCAISKRAPNWRIKFAITNEGRNYQLSIPSIINSRKLTSLGLAISGAQPKREPELN